jgi:predicted flap endonuclease-1-like 5' DNA nuclease
MPHRSMEAEMTFIVPEADSLTKAMRPFEALWAFDPMRAMEAASDLTISLTETTMAFWLSPFATVATPDTGSATSVPVLLPAKVETVLVTSDMPPVSEVAVATAAPKLFRQPVGTADDLQRIIGIGPKLSRLLNDIGIWHFHQIASWTPNEVSWVNDKIAFKGRIEREGWQKQASRLSKSVTAA